MILSTVYENLIFDLFRGYPIPAIQDFYVGLIKVDNTEVIAPSYARVHIDASPNVWLGTHGSAAGPSTGTTKLITSAVNISWGTALENWGTVDRVRFYTSPLLTDYFCDHVITPTSILSGASVEILTGDFIITTDPEALTPAND